MRVSGAVADDVRADMTDLDHAAWNAWVIGEFQQNNGNVPGYESIPLVLLTTTDVRDGNPTVVPLGYVRHGRQFLVAAVNGGRRYAPRWLSNLIADPRATLDDGSEVLRVHARVLSGEDLDAMWRVFLSELPSYEQHLWDVPAPIVVFTPIEH